MSIKLRELIRAVRACKTAAEERDVIAKESAALREAFREQDPRYRHRNVAKLMYIHMLGYPTHFGQMETLKLIAANGFPEKRIGYLGLMILLDERQEVLMLVTNSVKMDLNNTKNQYIAGLALAALGNICSAEMARDLAPEVERLLDSSNSYVRKKAALCAVRVLKKNPELVEEFLDKAVELLHDKNQAVLLNGVTLMLALCALDNVAVERFRACVPMLCKLLRGLLQSGFSPEHDVGGITNPFLQVKILQLLRLLGRGNAEASDAMTDILAQVAANVEGSRNAGNAILYEAVNTIMGIETIGGLRVMAVNILGRFLANKDNNIRYVALNTLAKVVAVDTAAVQRHRTTIVDCVKDADVSIRRRALELVYSLVNEGNITTLTRELLDYLAVCDAEFKPDLTAKVATLVQRFSPSKRWHIDSLMQVMVQAGPYLKEEVVRALLVLIANAPDLHAYAARAMYAALKEHSATADAPLLLACCWCIGEFGETLLPGAGGPLLEGEAPLSASEGEIVSSLEGLLSRAKLPAGVKPVVLTSLMKLTARLPGQVNRISAIITKYKTSATLEVQQRSCEYSRIFAHEALRPQLLERMPALEESEYSRNLATDTTTASTRAGPAAAAAEGGSGEGGAGAGGVAAAAAAPGDDLLDLLGGLDAAAAAVQRVSNAGESSGGAAVGSTLDDLLGVGAPSASAGGGGVLDMLGGGSGPSAAAVSSSGMSGLDDLLGGGSSSSGAVAAAGSSDGSTFPPLTVFDQEGVRLVFAFRKPQPSNPAVTEVQATFTNNGLADLQDVMLQAAVPKYLSLKLDPASGSQLPGLGGPPLTQSLTVTNTAQGAKPLVMRLRLSWTPAGGEAVLHPLEVANFPPGL